MFPEIKIVTEVLKKVKIVLEDRRREKIFGIKQKIMKTFFSK